MPKAGRRPGDKSLVNHKCGHIPETTAPCGTDREPSRRDSSRLFAAIAMARTYCDGIGMVGLVAPSVKSLCWFLWTNGARQSREDIAKSILDLQVQPIHYYYTIHRPMYLIPTVETKSHLFLWTPALTDTRRITRTNKYKRATMRSQMMMGMRWSKMVCWKTSWKSKSSCRMMKCPKMK